MLDCEWSVHGKNVDLGSVPETTVLLTPRRETHMRKTHRGFRPYGRCISQLYAPSKCELVKLKMITPTITRVPLLDFVSEHLFIGISFGRLSLNDHQLRIKCLKIVWASSVRVCQFLHVYRKYCLHRYFVKSCIQKRLLSNRFVCKYFFQRSRRIVFCLCMHRI